jgi:uncharacterized protein YaeQ
VVLYCFNHAAEIWWKGIETKLTRLDKPAGLARAHRGVAGLAKLAQRSMQLQATMQEGTLTLGDDKNTVDIEPVRWK